MLNIAFSSLVEDEGYRASKFEGTKFNRNCYVLGEKDITTELSLISFVLKIQLARVVNFSDDCNRICLF